MSSVSGGLVAKRFKNAIRPPGGRVDPFWSSVMVLAPLDGTGPVLQNLAPNDFQFVSEGTGTFIHTQDDTIPLFGRNTLHIEKTVSETYYRQFVDAPAAVYTAGTDVCCEYWVNNQDASAVSGAPNEMQFGLNLSGSYNTRTIAVQKLGTTLRRCLASPNQDVAALLNSGWHYCAVQYIGSLGRVYFSMDGVLIGNGTRLLTTLTGWRFFMPYNVSNSVLYTLRVAQMRLTFANRYGTQAAPVPSGPWPVM